MGHLGRQVVILLILTFSGSLLVFAQAPDPVGPAPSPDVASRLSQLEAETQTLRTEMEWLRESPVRLPATSVMSTGMVSDTDAADISTSDPQAVQGDYFTLEELRGEMKKLAWSKGDFTVIPYGILWPNMVYSTERTNPGSYTLWVLSGSTVPEHEFIVDARTTRLGLDVLGPKIECLNCAQSGGRVEIDFQNQVLSTENKPTIMLRHAYIEVKDEDFRLLGGQTWDVISPLMPGVLNYAVGWDAGNIGYRRAQFRGERYLKFSDVSMLTAQLSVNQQVFADASAPRIAGEVSNWPIVEGRAAWTIGHREPGCYPITLGVSGHIGEEEFDSSIIGNDDRRRTWSGNIDLRIPITERLGFQGECQVGENLDSFLGGIGQGVDPTSFNTIRDAGGWFEFWYDWTPCLHSHVGFSLDNPNDHDLHTAGERSYNQYYYGNLLYDVTKQFLVGLEVSSWETLYVGQLPGNSIRTEFAAKYGF
jgi:hypothetical protein